MNSINQKILFVHYSDVAMTGGERMTLQLLQGMLQTEYTPVFLTQRLSPLAEAAKTAGVTTIIVPLPKLLDQYDGAILRYSVVQKLRTVVQLLSYNRDVAKLLHRERISAVWCSNIRALLTVGFTVRALHIPLLWNIWLARRFGRWTQAVYYLCYYLPNHIVTEYFGQTNNVFRRLNANQMRTKITNIYTGIHSSFFNVCRAQDSTTISSASHPIQLLSCCRITPRKDVGCLLEAMALLSRRGRNFQLTIAGRPFSDGDLAYYEELIRQISRDGTGHMLRFAEWQDDVRPLFEAADIFVSSSSDEGLPGAIREAQASGLPVVATDAGGTSEAVADGATGFVVPCRDPQALADAIEKLADNPILTRNFGNAGRKRAAELFSIERFIHAYNDVFRKLIAA